MQSRISLSVWIILCVVLAGCVTSPPARFYTLSSLPDLQPAAKTEAAAGRITIGVGPIEVPAYLDRPQIVTRTGPNELQLAEFHRWAEPLADTLIRTLAENISQLLGSEAVVVVPWKRTKIETDYQIAVDVIRLDGNIGDAAALVAQWFISDSDGKTRAPMHKMRIREPTKGADIRTLVAAQSRAVERLSQQIAEAARQVIED